MAVLALAAALTLPSVGAAANVLTVKHDTVLHMNGSDVVCSVLQNGTSSTVACFHLPGGPSTTARKGYAIAANEGLVAVEPSGSTTPVKVEHEPSFDAQPMFAGGAAHSELVNLALNDEAKVSGTNMAVIVTPAKGGGNAIGVIYLDRKGHRSSGRTSSGSATTTSRSSRSSVLRRPRRSTATRRISPCASTPG